MHTERGFDRLVNFSDAVVAIAITLLVLPLVDSVTDVAAGTSVWKVIGDDSAQLMVFIVSFAVIGRFWIAHHRVYERAVDYDSWLLWANLFWLLTIVFLPYPTELLSESTDSSDGRAGVYVGTMLVSSLALLWQQAILMRRPALVAPELRGTLTIVPSIVTTGMMLVTFLAVVLIPGLGLWGLFLLLLTAPTQVIVGRMTGRRSHRATAPRPRPGTGEPPS